MKSSKHPIWKWRIALMMLAAWICLDGVEILTMAEVRPPRRRRGLMISPDTLKKKEEPTVDIGKSLIEIAQRASRQSDNQMVDLVFVIDGNVEMKGPGKIVEGRIIDIVNAFEESIIDYQFGLVWFQNAGKTSRITVQPLRGGLAEIEDSFRKITPPKFKGRIAGHGLDAIMKGLEDLQFRSDAEKHFVVTTNSNLKTSWEGKDGKNQVIAKILDWCKQDKIRINIIGIGEEVQVQLTDYTGGKWYPIDKYQRKIDQAPLIDRSILKTEGIFRRIAQHIAATVKQPVDIVFIYDSSLSMDNKVDEVCTGLDLLVGVLDGEGLDYRFGIIRFWAQSGGGESSATITQPPLNAKQVKKLFQRPRRGDEHLLDAIMEGVPKLKTPAGRKLVLFVVTDEFTTKGPEKKYTPAKAIEVCRAANAQVNVVGGVAPMGSAANSLVGGRLHIDFQQRVAEVTKGKHYIMPGSPAYSGRHDTK